MADFEFVVIGAGIAGLASAELLQRSGKKVLLVEAESQIGSQSSGELHGWMHTGALYAALPNREFLKTLVGNLQDLCTYYSSYLRMNLGFTPSISVRSKKGWFTSDLIAYSYESSKSRDVSLIMKLPWVIAQLNAARTLESLERLDFRTDISAQVISSKISRTSYTKLRMPLPKGLGKIGSAFLSKDRSMDTQMIMSDLFKSFINSGGKFLSDTRAIVESSTQIRTHNTKTDEFINFNVDHIISAVGRDTANRTTNVISPLLIIYPAVSETNFVKMTPNLSKTINHITHKLDDGTRYSVIGSGRYLPENAPTSDMEKSINGLLDTAVKVFSITDHHTVSSYFGTKTELVKSGQLRNYQYSITDTDGVTHINPGKFSLAFSLACAVCRRFGVDPITQASTQLKSMDSLFCRDKVATPRHRKLAEKLRAEYLLATEESKQSTTI